MRRCLTVLVTVQLLLLPAAASAVQATVTAPADGARFVVDAASPPMVHFAGTADVASVDLYCVASDDGGNTLYAFPITSGVAVTGGTFATDVAWPAAYVGVCEVFAVASGPAPANDSDLDGLTGSHVYPAFKETYIDGGRVYDYKVTAEGSGAEDIFYSFGDCTLDYTQLVQLRAYGGAVFSCNGYVEPSDPTSMTPAPGIVVDAHPAYSTDFIGGNDLLRPLPGWTDLSYAVADDGGSWRLESHEGIFRCADNDNFPLSGCTGFASTGVGLNIDEKLSPDGRTIAQQLRFVSEDGQPHTLSVILNQQGADLQDWFFPGTGGFQAYAIGASPSVVAPGVATIRNRLRTNPDPEDVTKGVGALTYAVAPSAEAFWDTRYFAQRYTSLTIPAGKATRMEFIYTMAPTTAELDQQAAAAEAAIGAPPAISVTSLPSTAAAAYTLTGTVNAPEVLNSFTVNDQPVTVAGDGGFSVPTTLVAGANQFMLKATDELNRTTTTPFSVDLSASGPPPTPTANPRAVVFGKSGKPKLEGRVLTTGYTATCPGTGPSCSIAATATAGRKKRGSGRATVNAGAKAKLKVKLTKAAVKQLKRKHKLKLSLKLTGKRTGAATTTTKKTLTLRKKR